MMQRIKAVSAWFQASTLWAAWQRFNGARGNILAAGVAYYAFFSLFPLLTLAFTVFGLVLRNNPQVEANVIEALARTLPGVIRTADNPDGLIAVSSPSASVLTVTGLVGLGALIYTGLGWLGAMREGIRTIFGVAKVDGNFVLDKLRDFLVLITLGATLFLSAIGSTLIGSLATSLADLTGRSINSILVTIGGLTVAAVIDIVVVVLLLRVLAGVPLAWSEIRVAAITGGLALALLQYFGGQLISLSVRNPAFGAIIGVVGLLFWLNLISRVILLVAAWAAVDIDRALDKLEAEHAQLHGDPAPPSVATDPAPTDARKRARAGLPTLASAYGGSAGSLSETVGEPVVSQRAADRTALAAGAVLGAAVAAGVGAAVRLATAPLRRRR